jgi:ubiquitin carboxyl-terminal hydrolase 6/32
VEVELNPLAIRLMKHQTVSRPPHQQVSSSGIPTMVGGYSVGAMASAAGGAAHYAAAAAASTLSSPPATKRYHAYNGAFSRRTTVKQIQEFLAQRLHIKMEDMRLWHFKDEQVRTRKKTFFGGSRLEKCFFSSEHAFARRGVCLFGGSRWLRG